AIKRVDLAPYFLISQQGTYQIVATVRIKGWNRELTSPPKSFDIIQGAKLWEQEVGVPKPPGATNSEPEIRRYILQQANYLRGQIRLYLRITDPYGKPIRVFAVGPMISFGRPEHQVDRFSNLHVLYQDGPSSYNYTMCNVDGEVTARRTYDYIDSRPRLRADPDGNITVVGGSRRITPEDVPRPNLGDSTEPPQPSTNAPPVGQLSVTKPGL